MNQPAATPDIIPNTTYDTILAPGDFVTGVRQTAGDDHPVLLTGNRPVADGQPQALLYLGPLSPTATAGIANLTPWFPGRTVTSSTFYGPNTPLFNPGIGKGNVRAVGSYKYAEATQPRADHGMIYHGPLDGSGTWLPLDIPEAVAGGAVSSTIAHSTMGDLVVGNFDLVDRPGSACAFIYDLRRQTFTTLSLGPLTTAYGIWQNGGDGSPAYTIVGGVKGDDGLNLGFVLDYDAATGRQGALATYSGYGKPGLITHFEGISGIADGYSLAATTDGGAAYAVIRRTADGGFGPAAWVPIAYPGTDGVSTGNTVIGNQLMGITTGSTGVQAYLATIG